MRRAMSSCNARRQRTFRADEKRIIFSEVGRNRGTAAAESRDAVQGLRCVGNEKCRSDQRKQCFKRSFVVVPRG